MVIAPNEPAAAGMSITIGEAGAAFATLLYSGPNSNYDPVEAATLYGGSVPFEEFGSTPGADIRGTVSTGLYGWAEVE